MYVLGVYPPVTYFAQQVTHTFYSYSVSISIYLSFDDVTERETERIPHSLHHHQVVEYVLGIFMSHSVSLNTVNILKSPRQHFVNSKKSLKRSPKKHRFSPVTDPSTNRYTQRCSSVEAQFRHPMKVLVNNNFKIFSLISIQYTVRENYRIMLS